MSFSDRNTLSPYCSICQVTVIGIFILIWVNDTFAYLVGRTFGRRKLFESVSPKKTIEGFIGGVIFSLAAAFILAAYEG